MPTADNSRFSGELTTQFLQETLDCALSCENRLRELASTVYDDAEVEGLFVALADQTLDQRSRLLNRHEQLSPSSLANSADLGPALNVAVQPDQASSVPEERTLQNLIAGYALAAGQSAVYGVLAAIAGAAGDSTTQVLATEMAEAGRAGADQIWHFLPSRSKIAFNMLTISEVDPSVETKVADNRLLES